jgi:glycosyltransferase involved in cell wall biosynthesis
MTPFYSILVPVYNHEKFVGLALDTLLAQTDPDWEACVVDDGSTDGTAAIVDDYSRRDPRIRVFHQANGGQAVALNRCVHEARGQWICWLSSDDLFDPHKLAVHRKWIECFPAHRYFFSKFRVLNDATGQVLSSDQGAIPAREWQVLELLSRNYINGITLCVHREAFQEVGLFDSLNRYGQDYDLHLRMLTRYEAIPIPEETCISRVHASQYSRLENRSMFYDCASAAVGYLGRTSFSALFPLLDLKNQSRAFEAVDRALDVATSTEAYVNQLGPHPLLLARIVEWVWGQQGRAGRQMQALVEWRVMAMAKRCPSDSRWSSFWKAAALWVASNPADPHVAGFTAQEIADAALSDLSARGDSEAEAVRRFIEKRQGRAVHQPPHHRKPPRDVLVDEEVGDAIVSELTRGGWRLTRVDRQFDAFRLHEWGWTVGVRSARRSVAATLAAVPLWDAAVMGSRCTVFLTVASRTVPVMLEQRDTEALDCLRSARSGARLMRFIRRVQWRVKRAMTC